ncbi:hypothetical protein [Pseudarcicella hirudinis]|uniref:hypothetical protein n=1 Tax=Pseudarcicella hirudinis TaxID=1079859 RepID=UPI0011608B0B|nr:hypothetical protein [Pseudarcicella hirudinis]
MNKKPRDLYACVDTNDFFYATYMPMWLRVRFTFYATYMPMWLRVRFTFLCDLYANVVAMS